MKIKPDQYGTIALATGIAFFGIGIVITSPGTVISGCFRFTGAFIMILGAIARNLFTKKESKKK